MSTRTLRAARLVRFGNFELDVRAAELRKNGIRIRLQEQPFRILVMLLERPGEIVLRDEIRRRLWPNDTVVEVGHGINAAILRLREALSESAESPRYIETFARRGYRFNGEAEIVLRDEPARSPSSANTVPGFDSADLEGRTISHFSVLEKLGGGGMGVVYRARDLTLGREVALKFLPNDLAGDATAVSRFQREARAASALNHPNVCTIYGVEDCTGQPAIVMEMIEGVTLAERLKHGPLALGEAVRFAIQVAGALDAAHRKAIVHRDLKPGNLLVAGSVVKVLDFGLAKIGRAAGVRSSSAHTGPAVTSLTQFGAVIGTLNYMSPEQVQGGETDARSDIYSFGLVLYEMLTGHRAIRHEASAAVELQDHFAPEALEGLVRRCLERDPEERWQSARDLKAALEWIAQTPTRPTRTPGRKALWHRAGWAAASVGAATFLALILPRIGILPEGTSRPQPASVVHPVFMRGAMPTAEFPRTEPSPARPVTRTALPAIEGLNIGRFQLSPDGRHLAFLSGDNLFVRSIATGATRSVSGSARGTPTWSPDGKWLAFSDGHQLKRVPSNGGEATVICDVNTNLAGAWGDDGFLLIGMIGDGIFRVPVTGGVPTRITDLDPARQETRHLLPEFLPGGNRFLFIAGSPKDGKSELFAGTIGARGRTSIMPAASTVVFVPEKPGAHKGYLVFVKERMLMAQAFDTDRLVVTGESQLLAAGIAGSPAAGAAVQVADLSVTADTIVYRSSSPQAGPAMMIGRLTVLQNWMASLK